MAAYANTVESPDQSEETIATAAETPVEVTPVTDEESEEAKIRRINSRWAMNAARTVLFGSHELDWQNVDAWVHRLLDEVALRGPEAATARNLLNRAHNAHLINAALFSRFSICMALGSEVVDLATVRRAKQERHKKNKAERATANATHTKGSSDDKCLTKKHNKK